jgi:hypothetical protein
MIGWSFSGSIDCDIKDTTINSLRVISEATTRRSITKAMSVAPLLSEAKIDNLEFPGGANNDKIALSPCCRHYSLDDALAFDWLGLQLG